MTRLFMGIGLASLLVLALALSAPGHLLAQGKPIIKIDGSSTVYPVTEAVAEEFQKSTKGQVRVTVGISGTGGGFKKFCRGETDISDASRPILKEEVELCRANGIKYVELPVAYDALTVVVNPQPGQPVVVPQASISSSRARASARSSLSDAARVAATVLRMPPPSAAICA